MAGLIEVWTLRAGGQGPGAGGLDILSPDEVEKGARFVSARDRELSWNARVALRLLLGKYLAIEPREIRFLYEPRGRPVLTPEHASDLQFSVSHSGDMIALAFSKARVGIDVETEGRPVEAGLLRRYRVRSEAEFLRVWTRDEAYLKALGLGITEAMPQEPPAPWKFHEFSEPGYIGAVATDDPQATFVLREFRWSDFIK